MKISVNRICLAIIHITWLMFLPACTIVGPDYQPPQQKMPTQWSTDGTAIVKAAETDEAAWWTLLQDPHLETLIADAAAANSSLRKAEARVREARAQRIISASAATLGTDGSAGTTRRSASTSTGDVQDLFQIGFDASWEVDIFGGVQRARESADASLEASHEELRDVLVSLQAEVANSYLNLRGIQKRLEITRNNIASQEKTVAVVEGRFQMGLDNELDLQQAKTQLALSRASIPALEKSIRQSMHQLAILLGQPPDGLVARLSAPAAGPRIPPQIPVNLPSDLLRQRPDIRAAERRLAAATSDIGVATAELFPRFSLTGLLGLQSRSLSDLVTSGSRYWSLGPSVSLTLFDQGRNRAAIEVRNARRDQALAAYEHAVLAALGEVENGLVAFIEERKTVRILEEAVVSGVQAVKIANGLYQTGLTGFLNVLQSERALYQSEDQLAQSEQRVNLAFVAIFKALGGGWQLEAKKAHRAEKSTAPPPS